MNDVPEGLQSWFDTSRRRAVRSCVPQQPGEAARNEQLAAEFTEDRAVAVLLEKRGGESIPFVVGAPNELEEHHLHIVTVTPPGAQTPFVVGVEVNEDSSLCTPVTDHVVEMQVTMRPRGCEVAALKLVDSAQFACGKDEGLVDRSLVAIE